MTDEFKIRLTLTQSPVYVHPPSVLGPEGSESSRYDKIVTGHAIITALRPTRIGSVKVAWELSQQPDEHTRSVLARYETTCRQEDSDISPGDTSIPFSLTISQLLPPYTRSPFDLIASRIFVSVLAPLPSYGESTTKELSNAEIGYELLSRRDESKASQSHEFQNVRGPFEKRAPWAVATLGRSSEEIRSETPINIPFSPAQTVFNRAWQLSDFPLPPSLGPSLANSTYVSGVISCPDAPGEQPVMEWEKRMRISGLGQVDCTAYSAYFACGSGIHLDLSFEDLGPLTTIQSIRFLLGEKAVAGDGCLQPGLHHDTWFTLYTRGDDYKPRNLEKKSDTPPKYVWRAEVPRVYDATSRSRGKRKTIPDNVAPTPLLLPKEIKAPSPQSIRLQTSVRLPSPIIGAHATSPALLDPRITRITHRLRLEVLFSVLGEDEKGSPLILDKSAKKKNPAPPEGTLRRLWVEHPVIFRCCVLGPENTKVPAYDEALRAEESFQQYLERVDIRKTPKAFAMQSTDQGMIVGEGGDLRERVEEHVADCVARCLCFYGDGPVFDLIKRKSDPVKPAEQVKAAYP